MKKNKWFFITSIFVLFFISKSVYAFDVNNYKDKSLCGNFEVAGFHSDGVIDPVACKSSYNEAKSWMRSNGAKDLAIMTKVNGKTKIIDANVALLDLSVNPDTLTYFFSNSELTGSAYTYMDTGSLYGGVDGAHIESGYSNAKGVWTAKVRIGNYTGWITQNAYEIVPITWINSSSSYDVTEEYIRHNYVAKIQNYYSGSSGRVIGPKPTMLSVGKYYSFDGHYFYNNLETLIKDYKNGNYNNSVNKNDEYYNYYMYLSNHTKTSYSSINIDEYIRNNLGIKLDAYGKYQRGQEGSRLYGSGTFFYYAQQKYGVNAILALSLSRNETGNGKSKLAIEKNNGFGLNAVDSNPIHAANWYPTFSSSILGYASKWITDGYAYPNDWRYFGPQFGDKFIGMNVKYASDTYWSEKMAANYYALDKALGLQDYNYYQLGVVTGPTNAYKAASTSSKFVYKYPEAEDAVVITGEVIVNGEKWYKLVSDLNVNNNYDYVKSSDYDWNKEVYVKASQVKKINKGKNGYTSPNSVTDYQDSKYTYNLLIENQEKSPKVGKSNKNTNYYYDSTLTRSNGQTLLNDRYVIVHTIAYSGNTPVAYLVSSDYFKDQKHWVAANDITLTTNSIGKVSVTTSSNEYTWVNYNTEDASYSKISGLYTETYVPVLGQEKVGDNTWYKVPVSLTSNNNVYGYTLASAPNVSVTLSKPVVENNKPEIIAADKTIIEGDKFNNLDGVKATDFEDGDITKNIKASGNVDTTKPGKYKLTYEITDKDGATTTKEITITVKENQVPVIDATDKTIKVGDNFKELDGVKATDEEDGDITKDINIKETTVDIKTPGIYKVIYEVKDSKGKTTIKEIKVTVEKKEDDKKDDNINPGDSDLDLDDLDEADGMFYLDYMKVVNNKLQIKGYNTINGIDNDLDTDIKYFIMYYNIDTEEYCIDEMNRIENKKEITRPVFGPDDKEYTYSWFKYDFDLKDLDNGNYILSVISMTDNEYSANIISNSLNKEQVTSFSGEKKVVIRNNYNYKESPVELIVRDNELAKKTASSYYNQYDTVRTLEFTDNKLHIKGLSYSYGINLGKDKDITRKIIFENKKTYKKYSYDLGYTLDGLYEAILPDDDNLSKDKAWYDKTIDLKELPKGTYTIYITTSANITDISELPNSLNKDLSKIKTTIDNKKYSFDTNFDRDSRIELIVE